MRRPPNRILVFLLTATALTLGWDIYAFTYWNAHPADDVAGCKWTNPIKRLPSGPYEIFTCVTRDKMPEIPRHPGLPPALITTLNLTGLLQFKDMIKIPDESWKLPVDNQVFKLHEQPLAMHPLVEFVKKSGYFPEVRVLDNN
ncbi:unnamed protein product [Dibothriocephalus latus]|uniref:Uncharacterized protein n=1 Tax=Dibothriocephalus latus TaxID=60516 RepID=A0A3P7LQX1_DIBLA|nr:unnamed protein product [Dibothriocephalus latus]